MNKIWTIGLILILVLALVSCSPAGKTGETTSDGGTESQKIHWKFGHLGNEDHLWHKTALKFAELVNEKSNGQIEVTVYPNEQLGSEIDTLNMIQSGTADITLSAESMANWAPLTAVMAVPYAFTSEENLLEVIESDIGDRIEEQIIEKVNVVPIYYHVRAPRNLTSNVKISKPEDLKGLKMRVPNVPLFLETWKEAGAQPQVLAFSEVFTALQQGVIGGQENPYDLIHSAGFYEVQKFANETEHVYSWIYVVLGKNQYDSLSDELKKAVDEAAAEAHQYGQSLFDEEIVNYKQQLIDAGMEINSDVDKEAFRDAMMPAIERELSEEQYELYLEIINFSK